MQFQVDLATVVTFGLFPRWAEAGISGRMLPIIRQRSKVSRPQDQLWYRSFQRALMSWSLAVVVYLFGFFSTPLSRFHVPCLGSVRLQLCWVFVRLSVQGEAPIHYCEMCLISSQLSIWNGNSCICQFVRSPSNLPTRITQQASLLHCHRSGKLILSPLHIPSA